jgi:phage terminase large subunit-like protein
MKKSNLGKNGLNLHADDLRAMGVDVKKVLLELGPVKAEELLYTWRFWARPEQLPPKTTAAGDPWNNWLINAGRGFGKTRAGVEWCREKVKRGFRRGIAVAATNSDIERVMIKGESGFLASCWKGDKDVNGKELGAPDWSPTKRTLVWSNGATITFFSAEEPERLRGPQGDFAWCDELCLIAGTVIETIDGPKAIELINREDLVLTRFGYKPVVDAWHTGKRDTWKITTASGKTLQGTYDHPVLTDKGWKSLGELKVGESTLVWSGEVDFGIKPKTTMSVERENFSTGQFMNLATGLSQKVGTCITKTKTRVTTIARTLSHFLRLIILKATSQEGFSKTLTQGSVLKQCGIKESLSKLFAESVGHSLNLLAQEQSFAQKHVLTEAIISVEKANRVNVYNLNVKDCHEYVANGIFNHNCAWNRDRDTWDMLQFCLRLGKHPQTCITTTPKPTKLIRDILKHPKTAVTTGSTFDNKANLAETYIEAVRDTYEGSRMGRQELYAEILDEASGALWTRDLLAKCEVDLDPLEFSETLARVVVSVDPAITSNIESDMTGIVVAGIDINGICYVLEDATGRYNPEQWATKAIELYHKYSADRLVAERNQGGDMVRDNFKTVDETIPVKLVHASRGKFARAEPVSSLYERGRVYHVRGLDALEDQLVQWEPLGSIGSPDRLDALVWAITELALKGISRPELNLSYGDNKGLSHNY